MSLSVETIREAERKSHEEIYSKARLFEEGSWLQKPVKTVLDILPLFSDYKEITVLDLGCGVGRNAIPIAQFYSDKQCRVDCVDILPMAIDMLDDYSKEFKVSGKINGIKSSIDNFTVHKNEYDLVISVSSLEHVESENLLVEKLYEIKDGVKTNGVVCLVINSQVREFDKHSGEALVPQFEVNLETERMQKILADIFDGWGVLKSSVAKQKYEIPRENGVADLTTNVVTYVTKNS